MIRNRSRHNKGIKDCVKSGGKPPFRTVYILRFGEPLNIGANRQNKQKTVRKAGSPPPFSLLSDKKCHSLIMFKFDKICVKIILSLKTLLGDEPATLGWRFHRTIETMFRLKIFRRESMKILKILGLTSAAFALVLGLFVATSNAQPGRARWQGNNGRHLGWSNGRHNGWNKGRKRGWDNDYYNGSYRRSRNRYYGYQTYYPNYGYQTYYPNYSYRNNYGIGSTILNVLGIGGYRNYGYNNGYYGSSYLTSKERRKNHRRYGW